MRITSFSSLRASVALAALVPALALAGCNRAVETPAANAQASYALPELPATLPLTTAAATPVRYAPEASELPDAAPIRTVRTADRQAGYAYADAAYGFSDALGDAPPDYGFDDGGDDSDPWAWQGNDDSLTFAEPVSDGYRSYYYRPGAEQPYFVRDPHYGYGYDDGQLAAVYGADGGIVPFADYGPRIAYAARYLARGRDLYRASRERRRPVIAANWAGRREGLVQYRRSWGEGRARQPQWAAYHQRSAPRVQQHWQDEAIRRQADSRRYANWQAQAFRTPPPPRAIPANWTQAAWAQDARRFAPVRAEAVAERRRAVAERRDDRALVQQRQQAQREHAMAARTDQRVQREQAQAAQAQRAQQRQAHITQRAQADDRQTAERAQAQQARAAQAAQRQQAQATRAERPAAQPANPARATQQAERAQARAAQEAQRTQAQQARAAQAAQRQHAQAVRAERAAAQPANPARATQQAERAQARAAQEAQRTQAQQARAAQTAQRQQAQATRAERPVAQPANPARAAQQAERAQARAAQLTDRAQREQQQQAQAAQRAQREQAQAARAQQSAAREQARQQQAQRQAARAANAPERER